MKIEITDPLFFNAAIDLNNYLLNYSFCFSLFYVNTNKIYYTSIQTQEFYAYMDYVFLTMVLKNVDILKNKKMKQRLIMKEYLFKTNELS